ncbi:MAG: hypothetical protein E6J82_00770 [Deltaproteobacteria bacterium]|nr:MAG: hypothetical protein E6J82_00770 [Deltaproteobacteria bacterium]TMA76382.1 MAG: hypothetical protein E6J67_05030 [Deltaproteobacteria bacterium]TMB40137.1 MAG: hypothetical protein E6J58_06305 [Deltaproteobacteria bacterium]
MMGIVAATLIYFLALDSTGKPVGKPQAHTRCWKVVGCRSWVRGQAICSRGSSDASAWLRKRRELRRCKLGSEVKTWRK